MGTWPDGSQIQWKSCNATGTACKHIKHAKRGFTYTLKATDAWTTIVARVKIAGTHGVRWSHSLVSAPIVALPAPATAPLVSDTFDGVDGLITNSFASLNPTDPTAVVSPTWNVSDGSWFRKDGSAWTGVPDMNTVDATSSTGNHSAQLRVTSLNTAIGDSAVSFRLMLNGFVSTAATPALPYDGVHVYLHYQDAHTLYVLSAARRDGNVVIKRQYLDSTGVDAWTPLTALTSAPLTLATWHTVTALSHTNSDGSVTVGLLIDGNLVSEATDAGATGAPLTGGAIGFDGDNADFQIDDLSVLPY